jgi:hypothetical protein
MRRSRQPSRDFIKIAEKATSKEGGGGSRNVDLAVKPKTHPLIVMLMI